MLERYKLRLGDGTIVGVDRDGLSTWLVDRHAMVQAAATGQWHPLNQFLARERAAARRAAARQKSAIRDTKASGSSRPLPLVYPKPRGAAAAPPAAAPAPSPAEPVEAPFAAEPTDISLAMPLGEAVFEPPPTEPLPAESTPPLTMAAIADEAPALFAAPFVGDLGPVGELSLPFLETPEPSLPEEPARLVRPEEPPPFVLPVEPEAALAEEPEPLLTSLPEVDEAPAALHASAIEYIPFVAFEAQSEPPSLSLPDPVFEADLPEPPLFQSPSPEPALAPPPVPPVAVPVPPPGLDLPPAPVSLARPSLQVLADDTSVPRTATERSVAGEPPIRLKPLDDEKPAAAKPDHEDAAIEGLYEEAPERQPLLEAFLGMCARALGAYDAWLTPWIGRFSDWLESRSTPKAESEPEPAPDPAPEPETATWFEGVTDRLGRITRRESEPLLAASVPEAPTFDDSEPKHLLKPPPPVSELPVIRLAYVPRSEPLGEVYSTGSGFAGTWSWARRLVGWGGFIAAVFVVASTWQSWVPKTAELGRLVAARIESIQASRERAERQQTALDEAAGRLPHLGPETIRMILARSDTGALDPSDVFYEASQAADRGQGALSAAEAAELNQLRAELLATLRPSERARVRAYDSTRARRFVFPFENGDVLEVYAQGALALPAESRERLQVLLAKAVAAGLAVEAQASPPPAVAP